ncbi:hypothetical protein MLD38_007901 [Melastoma candidum]|uniref:Uncharacterized protein n=1 Tax=Melastoma candidum TaxID=119954 RepID=A0ACB9RVN8_9MYRT|nr:hypothetical protein MLD38_007901 [Melastoma candidum]
MSGERNRRKPDKIGSDVVEKVVVAVKASKELPRAALVWALTHVVEPGDRISLLVVVPSQSSGRRLWGFPRFAGDCANGNGKSVSGSSSEQKIDITDSCSQMILQLHDVYDPKKINVKIKIVSGSPCGAVAAEAKKAEVSWVVLDKDLKHEEKICLEELQCNIVVMKRSKPKVLRLNLTGSRKDGSTLPALPDDPATGDNQNEVNGSESIRGPVVTPTSSPELGTPFTATEAGTSSVSSSDQGTSPFFITEANPPAKKESLISESGRHLNECSSSESESENLSLASTSLWFQPWMEDLLDSSHPSRHYDESFLRFTDKIQTPFQNMHEKFSRHERDDLIGFPNNRNANDFSGNLREAISLSRNAPSGPPPLCSICQNKSPVFGKPPRWFNYAELEIATSGFSKANFLAEGGFGSVHRGLLPDGQVIAVKQHKLASSQGDHEFCSEVEVLSCAQHRNVVMLIGFCIEDKRRLLVYEYICNGSLDYHLYGQQQDTLKWSSRRKIAVGAARGLRYLHEECRVGCIVHRDMRPNNILITHDFEPLVGDFGLARWQPNGDTGVETRVIGTFGYLAPEYAQSGQITEKADVYSFGVVLVELVTGRKAVDLSRPKGQQFLTEWARPLLEDLAINQLIDPRIGDNYSEDEVRAVLHAASLCIHRDPHSRPRMSQVLRILEGDSLMDGSYISRAPSDVGSGRMLSEKQPRLLEGIISGNEIADAFTGKLSRDTERTQSGHRLKH